MELLKRPARTSIDGGIRERERLRDESIESESHVRQRPRDESNGSRSRAWPRYEQGFTHFELGESADDRPAAVMANRYTPRYGVRKE